MAQYSTIARPYAKALFESANSNETKLVAWADVLSILKVVISEGKIRQFIADPMTTPDKIYKTLTDLVHAAAGERIKVLKDEVSHFLHLLIEYKRLYALPDMSTLYNQLLAEYKNVMTVEVLSAFELDAEQQASLQNMLHKRFGKKIEAKYHIDRSLIGGAIIRTDKFVIDGSIRGKLQKLYQSLIT
jgi:F-type H+-transporting ATPase subunit delta